MIVGITLLGWAFDGIAGLSSERPSWAFWWLRSELMLNGRTIVGLENVTTVHGQLALVVKLSDSTVVTSLISEFREAPAPDGKQIFPTAHLVVREAWNYMMVVYDGSNGVHNPSFSREALLATITALK